MQSVKGVALFALLIVFTVFCFVGCAGQPQSQGGSRLLCFKDGLPLSDGIYIQEIEDLIHKGVVEKYGREEFEASILTHEIHGHIGAYTLIGTKMGIYAMELLNAPVKKMQIVSEAGGGKYPVRCINDGIMVSTLCSYAWGALAVDTTKTNYAATFSYNDKTVRLELKERYKSELEAKIDDAVSKYKKEGKFTPEYWVQVEKMTWWIWKEWDRHVIFDVQWIQG